MSRTLIQETCNIMENEIMPRLKKGGSLPKVEDTQALVVLKNTGKITTLQLRQVLDKLMW